MLSHSATYLFREDPAKSNHLSAKVPLMLPLLPPPLQGARSNMMIVMIVMIVTLWMMATIRNST